MSNFTFPSFKMGNPFPRKEFDPTQFPTINEEWDETGIATVNTNNVSASGIFQNSNLPLEEQINIVKQKLAQYKQSLPNLNK